MRLAGRRISFQSEGFGYAVQRPRADNQRRCAHNLSILRVADLSSVQLSMRRDQRYQSRIALHTAARTWVAAALLIGLAALHCADSHAACIGEGVGSLQQLDQVAFKDAAHALPEIDRLLKAPALAPLSKEQTATLYAIAGEAHRQLGHTLASMSAANAGLQLLGKTPYSPVGIRLRSLHALMLEEQGDTTAAVEELTRTLANVPNQARATACLKKDRGFLRNTLGDSEGALSDLTAAYEYLNAMGPEGEAMVAAGRLARIYGAARAYDDAIALVNKTIRYFASIEAWVRLATAHERLGTIEFAQLRFAEALAQFAESRRLSVLVHDTGGIAYADLGSCKVHVETHELQLAAAECRTAEQALRTLGTLERFDQADLDAQFGRIALGRGQAQRALARFNRALASGAAQLDGEFGANLYRFRSDAHASLRQHQDAYRDSREYSRRLLKISGQDIARQVALQRMRNAIELERNANASLRRERATLLDHAQEERGERRVLIALSILAALGVLAAVVIVQRRRLAESARSAAENRLEELGRLTAGVAHEFNNLMTIVQQASGLLSRNPAIVADAGASSLLDAVHDAARSGGDITSQLLAFGRQQHLRPELIDCHDYLTRQRVLFEQAIGPGIALHIDSAPMQIYVDRAQLTSALINLLVNARDASAGQAAISIRAVSVSTDEQRKLVGVSVTDTGSGMLIEVIERATEPFFTTKEPGRGSGLGLSAVQGFARQSGGRLEIRSVPAQGTTVTLWLPTAA